MRLVTSPLLRVKAISTAWGSLPQTSPGPQHCFGVGCQGPRACPGEGVLGPELTAQTWAQAEVLVMWDGEASGSSWGHAGLPSGTTDGGSSWGQRRRIILPSVPHLASHDHTQAEDFSLSDSVIWAMNVVCVVSMWCVVLACVWP